MIDWDGELSVKWQAELLDVSRASVYYRQRPVSARDLKLMRRIDELHLEAPFYGDRPNQVWSSDLTYLPMAHGYFCPAIRLGGNLSTAPLASGMKAA
jgi:transposase InsO family protein